MIAKAKTPSNAGLNPKIVNPGTSAAPNLRVIPFNTKRKNPNVSTVNGKVNMAKIGQTIAFKIPRVTAANRAAQMFETLKPGTIYVVKMIKTAPDKCAQTFQA